jgi:hypothetical protein
VILSLPFPFLAIAFNPYMNVTPQSVVVFKVIAVPTLVSQLVQLAKVAQHNTQRCQLLVEATVHSFLLRRSHIKAMKRHDSCCGVGLSSSSLALFVASSS